MTKKDILIVGAGPAGLVAAINLNREGFNVIVREKEESVGGPRGWHPSVHTTPVGTKLFDYIGIDLSEAFVDSTDVLKLYMNGKEMEGMKSIIATDGMCNTERGYRESSLDSILYRVAKKEGVKFEFNKPFTKQELITAPKGTIIATGLSPGVYDWLGIEYSVFSGYWAYAEVAKDFVSNRFYFGITNEYGYTCAMNGIWYVLLFARRGVSPETLEAFKKQLESIEGRSFDKWRNFLGHTPKGPQLFYRDFILTGTMAGFIEPAFGGGITGALVSGKIASIAVTDPEKAETEFNRFADGIKKVIEKKRKLKGKYMPKLKMGDVWFKLP
jgi:flavin-dependent dehydrogenase